MKVAVVVFPGSNCDRDALHGARLAGAQAELVWHEDTDLRGADAVILPGGFAHGDYLETLDWDKTPPGPDLPAAVVAGTQQRYFEAFERITAGSFASYLTADAI